MFATCQRTSNKSVGIKGEFTPCIGEVLRDRSLMEDELGYCYMMLQNVFADKYGIMPLLSIWSEYGK